MAETDLISRQVAIEEIKRCESADSYDFNNGLIRAMNAIADIPSAQPKTGEWIELDASDACYFICDQCKRWSDFEENFCPNCGADCRGTHD